ncbi:MAG TPA: hypothetical protein VEY09_03820 [Pyrinomonadaceae bacterium]|nr:hypothetical protein [Pyrinomonadaceae bacterium]
MRRLLAVLLLTFMVVNTPAQTRTGGTLPAGYWPLERSAPIIEKTGETRLAPDLSHLGAGERAAVGKLLEVGRVFQSLYERQRHAQAERAASTLAALEGPAAANLATLYRLFQGPIATTLENRREPFMPVDPPQPGKNVYPWKVQKEELESFLAANPARRDEILDPRTVVRRSTADDGRADLDALARHPGLALLHPGLRERLQATVARPDPKGFYAVPYAVAYADQMVLAHNLLREAADAVQAEDAEFAGYLRNRARDLLTNDYESGDASWVTGRFRHLNAQIGAYETYDDELYGVKAFYSLSLMATRRQESEELRKAMRGLQALEESLPYDRHKRVKEDISVGAYDVIADFGQSRGGNTATILPNDALISRRYGRTIMMRVNIMRDRDIFAGVDRAWEAAVADAHKDELSADGNFYRTLWHEVGHYLGVDRTRDGRDLDAALQDAADLLEEMKADLVSLYVAPTLRKQDYYTDASLRAVYASGVNRVLQNNRPRRDQPYNTMQLMQWNYYLENGLLSFDRSTRRLSINYGKYHEVVGNLLREVLKVQADGDKAAAERFVERYTKWDEDLHGAVAANIRAQQRYRFRLFKYAALGE